MNRSLSRRVTEISATGPSTSSSGGQDARGKKYKDTKRKTLSCYDLIKNHQQLLLIKPKIKPNGKENKFIASSFSVTKQGKEEWIQSCETRNCLFHICFLYRSFSVSWGFPFLLFPFFYLQLV